MPFVEPPQGIVVGMLPPGQPQVRYLVPAGRLQLSARAHTGHEAIQPHAQQCTRMVGWALPSSHLLCRRQAPPMHLDPEHRRTSARRTPGCRTRGGAEVPSERPRMIQRQQLVKRRRQHPHLLSAHRSKRHLPNISHLGVASNVHLTHTQRQPRLLSIRLYCELFGGRSQHKTSRGTAATCAMAPCSGRQRDGGALVSGNVRAACRLHRHRVGFIW